MSVFSVPVRVEVLSSEISSASFIATYTSQQMGIGERAATTEANAAVAPEVIGDSGHSNGRKRKLYTAFSDDRAAIARRASENSVSQNA